MRPILLAPGLLLAAAIAAVATLAAPAAPLLGAPVIAILCGVAIGSIRAPSAALRPGLRFAARSVLQGAIIVSGLGISLATIARTGLATLPVTLATIAVALVLAQIAGRALRLEAVTRELVGVGTAICGASAIAALSSLVEATDAQTALAISVVFFYNVVAVLVFPPIGHALALSQDAFGVWAGTAINDTSSVVAAGFSYGPQAGTHATIVKLTRAMLILPLVGAFAVARARARRAAGERVPWKRIVPWFILWFVAAAAIDSLGVVPAAWHGAIAQLATALISVALAAIGLQTSLATLLRTGTRPLFFGLILWVAVAASSLTVQRAFGL